MLCCCFSILVTETKTRKATRFAVQSEEHSCANAILFSGRRLEKAMVTSQHTWENIWYTPTTRRYTDPNCCNPNGSKANSRACSFFTYQSWGRTKIWSDFSYDTFYVPFIVVLVCMLLLVDSSYIIFWLSPLYLFSDLDISSDARVTGYIAKAATVLCWFSLWLYMIVGMAWCGNTIQ